MAMKPTLGISDILSWHLLRVAMNPNLSIQLQFSNFIATEQQRYRHAIVFFPQPSVFQIHSVARDKLLGLPLTAAESTFSDDRTKSFLFFSSGKIELTSDAPLVQLF
jgi:hypothetical protein